VSGGLDRAGPPTRDRIRKILSSALTWGVEHRGDLISANGCKLVTTRRHRRSGRPAVSSPASRPERALSAEAAERIARAMLARTEGRTWEPHHDAILLRCQFGLGLRPEEIAAARWRALARPTSRGDWMLVVDSALSHGRVTGVKTIERSKRVPSIVREWLAGWRDVARAYGLPTNDDDFIVPGAAGAGHFTLNQHKKWGGRYFRPAAESVARAHPHLTHLARATPYAARRGHITCRILAGQPVQVIAELRHLPGNDPSSLLRRGRRR
jgi:integrase